MPVLSGCRNQVCELLHGSAAVACYALSIHTEVLYGFTSQSCQCIEVMSDQQLAEGHGMR